ncbi:MAG TPA: glycosyltransferase family 2 protein [Gemmatimonadales bacterium]|nr:glycosyltransferase family 2 protein [Gemmatimonadales bacterium]
MSEMPLVTVVTPFYNTADYLPECIESVLTQTYEHFEYILLNNRSTDDSLAIAEQYAQQDPRIRVITNRDFLEQDMNFSEGLRQASATSRYCKMVLADDWLFPRCIEQLVAVAEAHPTAGLVGSYYLKGTTLMGGGLPYPSPLVDGRRLCRLHLLEGLFVFGSPTVLLLRTDVVRRHHPFYDPRTYHADTEACYRTLTQCDFGFVHQVLSFLRTDNPSRMARVRDFGPSYLDKLIVITKYGRDYLSPEEFDRVSRRQRHAYFQVLGDGVLSGRPKAFWDYHRDGLATIGIRLSWHMPRLWLYTLLALADAVLNPLKTALRIRGALRKRKPRGPAR